jgi:hypothetical protein
VKRLIILVSVFALNCSGASKDAKSPFRIGVVENQFDHVETILQKMKIPFKMIKPRDIESENIYQAYDAIFFPCGAEMQLNSSVNIMSRGSQIQGMSLTDQYYKVDMKKTGELIAGFVQKGGSAYFSDFSYKYLQSAFPVFSFYKDFPYLGLEGQGKVFVQGELTSYIPQSSLSIYFNHQGWIFPAEIKSGKSFLTAEAVTPIGTKRSAIAALMNEKKGIIIYSSYHDISDPYGIMRFMIMRTVNKRNTDEMENLVSRWGQIKQTMVTDRVLAGETSRTFNIPLKNGKNTLYFLASSGKWQIDILSSSGALIHSFDNVGSEYVVTFLYRADENGIVRAVSLDKEKGQVITFESATGIRLFPYWIHFAFALLGLGILVGYLVFIHTARWKGRVRMPIGQ